MDCPSEENLIRMRLQDFRVIKQLDFNLENRELIIFHTSKIEEIGHSLNELQLDSSLISSEETNRTEFNEDSNQRKLLIAVLAINFLLVLLYSNDPISSSSFKKWFSPFKRRNAQ